MQIKINGELEKLEADKLTVTQLLSSKNVESPDMVSVQLNGAIIDRSRYDEQNVGEGDVIDFLYFMGGGAGR